MKVFARTAAVQAVGEQTRLLGVPVELIEGAARAIRGDEAAAP
jgi:hypothetical protein